MWQLAATTCTELFLYRKPIPPSSFKYDLSNSGGDLRIRVVNPCWFATLPGVEMGSTSRFGWEFDLREGQLHRVDFVMPDVPISPKSDEWSSNSKISSLQDLLGAQLIVQARTGSIPPSKEIAAFRQSISVAILVIRLPSGVVLQFDADNLKLHQGRSRRLCVLFHFSEDDDGASQLHKIRSV